MNKPIGKFSPGGTNDPHTRYCDPFGFPQNMTNEIRGMTINDDGQPHLHIDSIYGRLARNLDGWACSADQCGRHRGRMRLIRSTTDIQWATGKTTIHSSSIRPGWSRRTWTTKNGYPHSIDAHVQERFHRDDKNDLTLTITMDDPKLYTKQFALGRGALPVDS